MQIIASERDAYVERMLQAQPDPAGYLQRMGAASAVCASRVLRCEVNSP